MKPSGDAKTLVGFGAAACVACCIGPVLGTLSAIGLASLAGMVLFGGGALVVGAVAAAFVWWRRRRRRRRRRCRTAVAGPVPVTITSMRR